MPLVNPDQPTGETLQFMQRLWALADRLDGRSKKMATVLGVTGPQRLVIRTIGQHGGSTAAAIAASLNIHRSTLRGMVLRLEEGGFVARGKHPDDRRREILVLTPRGVRIDRQRHGTIEAAVRRVLRRVDPRRVANASRMLAVLAELLREEA